MVNISIYTGDAYQRSFKINTWTSNMPRNLGFAFQHNKTRFAWTPSYQGQHRRSLQDSNIQSSWLKQLLHCHVNGMTKLTVQKLMLLGCQLVDSNLPEAYALLPELHLKTIRLLATHYNIKSLRVSNRIQDKQAYTSSSASWHMSKIDLAHKLYSVVKDSKYK